MSQRIKYNFMEDGAMIRWSHLGAHADIFVESLFGAVQATPRRMEGRGWAELENEFINGITDELMQFAVVSIYHYWEKQAKSLIMEQLGWTKERLKKAPGSSDADKLLGTLARELSAPTPPHLLALIEEARQLTNLIKHDPGTGYADVEKKYPAHFIAGAEDPEDRFKITRDFARRLAAGLCEFWEKLPRHVDRTNVLDWTAKL